MQYTLQEERLILRMRKRWHKVFRIIRNTLAIICLGAIALFQAMAHLSLADRRAYEAKAQELRTVTNKVESSEFIIPANQYTSDFALISDCYYAHKRVFDSLSLSEKELGFGFTVFVLPVGIEGYRSFSSAMGLITTDCACEKDTLDIHVLTVDSTMRNASVFSSQKNTLADLKTLDRLKGGDL